MLRYTFPAQHQIHGLLGELLGLPWEVVMNSTHSSIIYGALKQLATIKDNGPFQQFPMSTNVSDATSASSPKKRSLSPSSSSDPHTLCHRRKLSEEPPSTPDQASFEEAMPPEAASPVPSDESLPKSSPIGPKKDVAESMVISLVDAFVVEIVRNKQIPLIQPRSSLQSNLVSLSNN